MLTKGFAFSLPAVKTGGNFAKGHRMTAHFLNEGLFWALEETEDPEHEEQLMRKEKQQ